MWRIADLHPGHAKAGARDAYVHRRSRPHGAAGPHASSQLAFDPHDQDRRAWGPRFR